MEDKFLRLISPVYKFLGFELEMIVIVISSLQIFGNKIFNF